MTEAGMASNELSKRSSIPPCPGRILPLSLICNCRFRRLSTRSPHVPNITTVSASPNHSHLSSDGSKQAKSVKRPRRPILLRRNPPTTCSERCAGTVCDDRKANRNSKLRSRWPKGIRIRTTEACPHRPRRCCKMLRVGKPGH